MMTFVVSLVEMALWFIAKTGLARTVPPLGSQVGEKFYGVRWQHQHPADPPIAPEDHQVPLPRTYRRELH
jgi:hypothetical protein